MKKVLFTATVDSHILHFHIPFLKFFKENGYEVHVATNGDEEIPFCDKKIKISFERSPYSINNLKAIKELKKVINKEKYDIIHTHTPMGSVVTRLAAKSARKKYSTRVIYTAHGFHFFKGASKLNWLLFYPVEKFLAKYTDTLITINMEDYNLAKDKFSKRCKNIEYVPGVGIDEEKFNFKMSKKEQKDLRKSLGLTEDDFVLIYPAELSKRKRQIWLINTLDNLLKKHKDIHLLLPGKDSLKGECQKLVEELKLDNQIHFLGYRKDIPKLLKISNLAISSARQEGLPVNIMEAMYIGIPIVASNCRGNRDLVKNNKNGYLIDLYDNINFSKKIEKLYKNKETYDKFSKENKEIIKDYLLEDILPAMNKIYRKIKKESEIVLIIPTCTDFNRGDQALVLETKKVIDKIFPGNECYMMSTGETIQCEMFGLKKFSDILKHPSRYSKNKSNVKYNLLLKIKWGIIALFDLFISLLLLNKVTRMFISCFLKKETKKSLQLYEKADYIFVKGGGFLHDYSGGLVGLYTIYYQTFHIKLALKMGKKVYIMPNSYGPFKNMFNKNMVNKILDKCELVTARESISASENTNTLNRKIDLYPDLAFFLDKNKSTFDIEKKLKNLKINISKDKLVAITVRPYRFYSYDNPKKMYYNYKLGFSNFIDYLRKNNYKVLLVVHTRAENDHENDERCIDEILEMLRDKDNVFKIKDDNLNCYDLKKLYGYCKYVIGTRFHSVIFSLEQYIPCIAITYGGNKGDGIMKDLGLDDYSIKIGELNSDNLIKKFEMMKKNEKDIKNRIKVYLKESHMKYNKLLKKIKGD